VRGLPPGLQATVALDTIDIIVSGPKSILDALESDDVFVILNLGNLTVGAHVLTPDVVYPDGVRLEGVLPETVEVIITNATPTGTITTTATTTQVAPIQVTPVWTPPTTGEGSADETQ
jgi:hypothetical protein